MDSSLQSAAIGAGVRAKSSCTKRKLPSLQAASRLLPIFLITEEETKVRSFWASPCLGHLQMQGNKNRFTALILSFDQMWASNTSSLFIYISAALKALVFQGVFWLLADEPTNQIIKRILSKKDLNTWKFFML